MKQVPATIPLVCTDLKSRADICSKDSFWDLYLYSQGGTRRGLCVSTSSLIVPWIVFMIQRYFHLGLGLEISN